MFMCYSDGRPVSVGLTDVTPRNRTAMSLDDFQIAICGRYNDPSLRHTVVQMDCPRRSVVGRYLVVQTNTTRGGHVVCEAHVAVEGTQRFDRV